MIVLGVDPGRDKCGVAVCAPGAVLARAIVPPVELEILVARWVREHRVSTVVIGGGTGSKRAASLLTTLRIPVVIADERLTTLAARERYFRDHPPRGWRRFVPLSLQVPPEPYDDYAAVLIAEAYVDLPRASNPNICTY